MKLWVKCRDFLRTPVSPLFMVACGVAATVLAFYILLWPREPKQSSTEQHPYFQAHPDSGAVLFQSGVFCSFDGRNFYRTEQLGDGSYVCFVPSDGGIQQ